MNKRVWIIIVFAIMAAAQLAVPAWMICEREWTLRHGQLFKFKTQPVDPADAFRGRYIWLRLEPESVVTRAVNEWRSNQKAYAVLGTDTNGFAIVLRLEKTAPDALPALPIRVSWTDANKGATYIRWNLDRYYMTEDQAPAAERAGHTNRASSPCASAGKTPSSKTCSSQTNPSENF